MNSLKNGKEDEKKEAEVLEPKIIIPQCCREGWENCPHQVRRPKKTKKNIGL